MKNYTHHFEIEDILQQFAAALNDIIVKRYNIDRAPSDQLHVNFVYAPKSRVLSDLVTKNQHFKLPCISISIGGMRRAPNRVFNKINGSWFADTRSRAPSAQYWANLLQPVPVDITVNVSIIARFQSDIDQILTNFIPYTDPYFVISWKWPDLIPFSDFEIRSTVKWGESVDYQYPKDIAAEASYWTNADTSFTIEGWIFKNRAPDGKPIYVIEHSFTSVSGIEISPILQTYEGENNTEYFTISARPQPTLIDPFYVYLGNETIPLEKQFTVTGKMIDYVETVYLSSGNWDMFNYTTTGDFITAGPLRVDAFSVSSFAASAAYPAFSGIEMLSANWAIVDNNHLSFSFTPQTTGIFDVILLNEAGYGILTHDCIRPTLNPYPIDSAEYSSYVEYQYPCASGVEVREV